MSCGKATRWLVTSCPVQYTLSPMYQALLFTHSWLRWAVLLGATYCIARAARGGLRQQPWSSHDQRANSLFARLVDVQFLLGLLLYLVLSPITKSAFQDMGSAMRSAPLRFFAVEHITAMFLAIAVLHVGRARARRKGESPARHGTALRFTCAYLVLTLIGIPWPFLKHGRPLARLSMPVGEQTAGSAPELYERRCAACHGMRGMGDGPAAAAMQPRPRDFRDARWQGGVSDAQLEQVIREGGLARGLSTNMPPHADLRADQVKALVGFIRAQAKK